MQANQTTDIEKILPIFEKFSGVKRRFELLSSLNNIFVFDDFAHHPTAISATIAAFRSYMKETNRQGRLIICFDPKNATMRRNILQHELSQSLQAADLVLLGEVPKDLRLNESDILNPMAVIEKLQSRGEYFSSNSLLLEKLKSLALPEDVVVFMSSGAFDKLPQRFVEFLHKQ